jgi:hypothetical protein
MMIYVVRQRFALPADLNLLGKIVVQSKFGSDARLGSCASAPRALSSLKFVDGWPKSNLICCPMNLWSASPTACLDLTAFFCWSPSYD